MFQNTIIDSETEVDESVSHLGGSLKSSIMNLLEIDEMILQDNQLKITDKSSTTT